MKTYYLITFLIFSTAVFSQERVNATLPKLNPVPSGRLPEVMGWTQNDAGEWISRKNRIPANLTGGDKTLMDYENYSIGELGENFIDISIRDVTINNTVYKVLIKKYKNGYFKYSSIQEGWVPYNALDYFVFKQDEQNKFKNLEPNIAHEIKIETLYSNENEILIDRKDYLGIVSENLPQAMVKKADDPFKERLVVYIKLYQNKVRFLIQSYKNFISPDFSIKDFDKHYYETTKENFEKLLKLN